MANFPAAAARWAAQSDLPAETAAKGAVAPG